MTRPYRSLGPQRGSLNDRLWKLAVGERIYIESTLDEYVTIQRRATAASRFPAAMATMRFTCGLYTAVSASNVADIRYLVSVERTQ